MLSCLVDSVGVTDSDCQCFTQNLTQDQVDKMKKSNSGLFLDDLPGGIDIKAIQSVDACRKMYDITQDGLKNGIIAVEEALVLELNSIYQPASKTFMGTIGRQSYSGTMAVSKNWQGVRLRPVNESDAVMELSRFMIVVNEDGTFRVRLFKVPYNSVMGVEVTSWEVTTQANTWTNVMLPTPLRVTFRDSMTRYEYYLAYDRTEVSPTMAPKDTDIECGTCSASGSYGLVDYLKVDGFQADDMGQLNMIDTDRTTHGLVLEVKMFCDDTTLICREYSASNPISIALAHALWFKAGELMIADVLKQSEINRYTTMDHDKLVVAGRIFHNNVKKRIEYVASTLNVTDSNCYICRENTNQPFIGGILV